MKLVLRKILPGGKLADGEVFEFSDQEIENKLDRLQDVPQEVIHKALFNPSFRIRAKAVSKEIHDVEIAQKYIAQETCHSNLLDFSRLNFFESLPLNTRAELFNKCPDALVWNYSWDDFVHDAKEISQRLEEPFARNFLMHLSIPVKERRDDEDRLWKVSIDGSPVLSDAFDVVSLLRDYPRKDSTQKSKLVEALVHNPDPDIRYNVTNYVEKAEQIKALALDPYFYIREEIIKTSSFAQTDFSVEELMDVIADDPQLAEMVMEKHKDRELIHALCERLAESKILEIRAMAIHRLSHWNLFKDLYEEDEDDVDIAVDADEDELDDDLLEDLDE